MKRRTSELGSGSLDLFLDAVCNTFGGIVFMAIMLAVLIQTRAIPTVPETPEEAPPSASELRQIVTQLDDAITSHAELARALAQTPPITGSTDGQEYHDLLALQQSLQAELSGRTQRQLAAARQVAAQMGDNAALQAELEEIPAAVNAAQNGLEAAQALYTSIIENRQTTLRLPRVQSSDARSALLLVTAGRVFVARSAAGVGDRFLRDQVQVTKTFTGGFQLKPRQGSGWLVTDPRVADLIAEARRGGSILTIAIWPDSFESFAEIKPLMIENGVQYRLWPQAAGEVLTVFLGGGASSVQ